MKKVLIVGKDSYIGDSFARYLEGHNDFAIDIVDSFADNWKQADFSNYDVVYHVAAIVHKKENKKSSELCYKVNRDHAYEVALRAKTSGVKQFIFLSTMSVYGIEKGVITKDTIPTPKTYYGKSKYEAEQLIKSLNDKEFRVAILRPPMIYGEGCKGNYQRLRKLALKLPVFPNIKNERSMLYIDNLNEFVKLIIKNNNSGVFLPQNMDYVCTSEMVSLIANHHNKNIRMTKVFNPIIKIFMIGSLGKVFGSLIYDKELGILEDSKGNNINYNVYGFNDTVALTEESN